MITDTIVAPATAEGKAGLSIIRLSGNKSHKICLKLTNNKVKFIDLSADFRLRDSRLYKKWYGVNHKCKELIDKSVYAITEFSRDNLDKYKIISCPGCYPTSVQIPLIPLIEKKMINVKNIIIDSKSGYSGAGKNVKSKFKNISNSVSSYGVGSHRHMAEIDQELSKVSKKKINVSFTPHVIPMFRGIMSTIYLETLGINNARKVYNFLRKYHKKNFFVKKIPCLYIFLKFIDLNSSHSVSRITKSAPLQLDFILFL